MCKFTSLSGLRNQWMSTSAFQSCNMLTFCNMWNCHACSIIAQLLHFQGSPALHDFVFLCTLTHVHLLHSIILSEIFICLHMWANIFISHFPVRRGCLKDAEIMFYFFCQHMSHTIFVSNSLSLTHTHTNMNTMNVKVSQTQGWFRGSRQ